MGSGGDRGGEEGGAEGNRSQEQSRDLETGSQMGGLYREEKLGEGPKGV